MLGVLIFRLEPQYTQIYDDNLYDFNCCRPSLAFPKEREGKKILHHTNYN